MWLALDEIPGVVNRCNGGSEMTDSGGRVMKNYIPLIDNCGLWWWWAGKKNKADKYTNICSNLFSKTEFILLSMANNHTL